MKTLACTSVVLTLCLGAAPLAAQTVGSKKCMKCHKEQGEFATFEDGATIPLAVDYERYLASGHGRQNLQCADCHTDIDLEAHPDRALKDRRAYTLDMSKLCVRCHEKASASFANDVHRDKGACVDCHDPHASAPAIPQTCASCHRETADWYARSAHTGAQDVPVCTDCHRAHPMSAARTLDFHIESVALCERCHGDAEKMSKHGLSTAVMTTYLQDFHGVSVTYDRKRRPAEPVQLKATCIDCHGAHDIARKESPRSLAIKANRAKVCGKCHENATESFSQAWLSHYIPGPTRAPLVYFVRLSYWIFIPLVIAGLLAHILMDFFHLFRTRRHQPATDAPGPMHVRFTLMRRLEHVFVMATFTLLMLTGLPQKFHDTRGAEWMILAFGGIDAVRVVHRVTGIVFALQAAWHIAFNVAGMLRGRVRPDMIPARRDFTDALASVRYNLGLSARNARCDRYDFRQKFEYWGMVIGGLVMVVTGFTLYFPTVFARYLPGDFIPAAKAAHSFEAMMALLVILVWHFYCAHVKPELFPVDTSIFTGRISRARMIEEHPLEIERLNGGPAER
ncbi:MAG: cytochrome c3 family protein [Planctomycetes bacterium]|nr:cytochrome c3 family protein [Planctomycetota bacterium]